MALLNGGSGASFTAEHLNISSDKAADSVQIWSDTVAAGGGTKLQPLVDAAGHFQIDVLSLPGSLVGYAEDSVHSTGHIGLMNLAVRQDTATQLAGTDGDYSPIITDANGRLHVLDQNSAAIKTAVEIIDNAISGTEMQVDVVAALPAGTNTIGKLAANSGVDIGDVDVTSYPTVSATVSSFATTSVSYVVATNSNMQVDYEGLFSYVIQQAGGTVNLICQASFSNDNTNWEQEGTEVTIAGSSQSTIAGTAFYRYVRLMVKSADGTSVTTNSQGWSK